MQKPYVLITDIWEGNPDVDPKVLMENEVMGMIVRLNDMNGGHHMDEAFEKNWANAKKFPIQALYFVYNPWKNGKENYDWLMSHIPLDYGKRRIFVDIEVRYPGYSPKTYGSETAAFMVMLRAKHKATRYSGGGFLSILTPWPKDEEYWWAAYSTDLTESTSWEDYKNILSKLSYALFTKLSPGLCRLWQATGDGLRLPGFGKHAVDVNVFPGTLEEAFEWFGCVPNDNTNNEEEKENENMETNPPIGLFTKKPGWTVVNPNYNFVVGLANKYDPVKKRLTVEPSDEIKPIELEAKAGNIPFFLCWEHLPWAYGEQQWGPNNWPDEAHDYIFQNFKAIMAARSYQAVVVSISTYLMENGQHEDKGFISYSAKRFMERVGGWLKATRPLVPLIIATSDKFMTDHAPGIKDWAHNYYSMAVQSVLTNKSYPVPGTKPAYLGASKECPWWRYMELGDRGALMIFRGENGYPATVDGMKKWLNISTGSPPTPPHPERPPEEGSTDLEKEVAALAARLTLVEAALKKPIMS